MTFKFDKLSLKLKALMAVISGLTCKRGEGSILLCIDPLASFVCLSKQRILGSRLNSNNIYCSFTMFCQRWDTSEMLIRGLNVVVLNEVTGAVMSSRWYDTYESAADSGLLIKYLKGLRQGRIVCFAVRVRL